MRVPLDTPDCLEKRHAVEIRERKNYHKWLTFAAARWRFLKHLLFDVAVLFSVGEPPF